MKMIAKKCHYNLNIVESSVEACVLTVNYSDLFGHNIRWRNKSVTYYMINSYWFVSIDYETLNTAYIIQKGLKNLKNSRI